MPNNNKQQAVYADPLNMNVSSLYYQGNLGDPPRHGTQTTNLT